MTNPLLRSFQPHDACIDLSQFSNITYGYRTQSRLLRTQVQCGNRAMDQEWLGHDEMKPGYGLFDQQKLGTGRTHQTYVPRIDSIGSNGWMKLSSPLLVRRNPGRRLRNTVLSSFRRSGCCSLCATFLIFSLSTAFRWAYLVVPTGRWDWAGERQAQCEYQNPLFFCFFFAIGEGKDRISINIPAALIQICFICLVIYCSLMCSKSTAFAALLRHHFSYGNTE
jgi:hypothetical protein